MSVSNFKIDWSVEWYWLMGVVILGFSWNSYKFYFKVKIHMLTKRLYGFSQLC